MAEVHFSASPAQQLPASYLLIRGVCDGLQLRNLQFIALLLKKRRKKERNHLLPASVQSQHCKNESQPFLKMSLCEDSWWTEVEYLRGGQFTDPCNGAIIGRLLSHMKTGPAWLWTHFPAIVVQSVTELGWKLVGVFHDQSTHIFQQEGRTENTGFLAVPLKQWCLDIHKILNVCFM